MTFDIRTIVFSNLLVSVLCCLVLMSLWRQNRHKFSGTGLWVGDFALQTIAFLLIVSRGTIPQWVSTVLANTLVIAGAILGYIGLERFVGQTRRQHHNVALLMIFAAAHTYFLIVRPDLTARSFITASGLLIICFQCAWLMLYRASPRMRNLTCGVGLVFAAYCILSIIRMVKLYVSPGLPPDYFQSGGFEFSVLIAYQLLFVLLAYSLILMVNKRLHLEISAQKAKFSKAFHSSPNAIALTRLSDGHIEEVNDAFLRITGYRPEEVIGNSTIALDLWGLAQHRVAVIQELSKTGKIRGRELQFRAKTGEMVTGLFSAETLVIDEGEYILSSISDITDRKRAEDERERLIGELKTALGEVKTLRGLIPICSGCKKIRDDEGYWQQVEKFVEDRSEAQFSHGICPECMKRLYPAYCEDCEEK